MIFSELTVSQSLKTGEKDIYDNVVRTEENKNINGKVIHNPYLKVKPEHILSNIKTKFDGNADVFDVGGDELKRKFQPTSSKQTC